MMAVDNSLKSLLAALATSIQSATGSLPTDHVLPPKEGISLLDVKNELLVSYLQNLVFLILLKLRRQRPSASKQADNETLDLQDDVVKQLVGLRLYLEKGIRPLESRMKYSIDSIIRAADHAERRVTQDSTRVPSKNKRAAGSESADCEAESAESAQTDDEGAEKSHGPRNANIIRPVSTATDQKPAHSNNVLYRPPRITPMTMPTTESKEQRRDRRAGKSATLDEFIATEFSSAPVAEPSIGSTIVSGGRRMKSERERREDAEKREYEESNFTRLPRESKKDMAMKKHRERAGFGGEEWATLGRGLDRIENLTQKKSGLLGSLEKSRKRPTQYEPISIGSAAGDAFEKRRKTTSRHRK